jgi:hypothetical protein
MTITVAINRTSTVATLETQLAQAINASAPSEEAVIRLASNVEGGILSDVWAAIVAATVCRAHRAKITAWGVSGSLPDNSDFAASLPCLACLPIAHKIGLEDGQDLDRGEMMRAAATEAGGLIRPTSGAAQALVEFDPEYSIAQALQTRMDTDRDVVARRRLFERLVLQFRNRLEIGGLRRGHSAVALGAAGDVGRFLAELHENGLEHGSLAADGRRQAGARYLRTRKHIANSRAELLRRSEAVPELHHYIERTFAPQGTVALVEASISDTGLGIVDGFLSSPAGRDITLPRSELLDALVYDRLTSKSNDPGAGLGIRKALSAARSMQAFVSLRTGEFWRYAAFLPETGEARLAEVAGRARPGVAGTHWQILWPQP